MSDIPKRIKEIDDGQPTCFEPTEGGEKFWHEGVGAFYKDLLVEQCPYPAGLVRSSFNCSGIHSVVGSFGIRFR